MIKAVIYLPKPKLSLLELVESWNDADINYQVISDFEEFSKSTFDILVTFGHDYDKVKKITLPKSKIIFLVDKESNLSKVYQDSQKANAFSILNESQWNTLDKEIRRAYKNLIKDINTKSEDHQKIMITSFKGGVGKSLLSVNLAYNLKKYLRTHEVLLIDASMPFGCSKAFLDIDSSLSWNTIRPLLSEENALSSKRLNGVVVESSMGAKVLAAPRTLQDSKILSAKENNNLLKAASNSYKLIVEDLPTIQSDNQLELLKEADQVVIVMTPGASSLYNTHLGLTELKNKLPEVYSKVHLVLNRYDKNRHKSIMKLLEERLGITFFAKIEDDSEAVDLFTQKAMPFDKEDLLITNDFKALAEKMFKKVF